MATVRPARTSAAGRTAFAAPPGAYVPMQHPGRPNSWDRESIHGVLRAWVEQTGRPPRRLDWSGERPQAAGPAQRKWMREHPRWPSSSCVAAHFGSWSKALQAAGLSRRSLAFEDPVADRVEAAWRLAAAGQTVRAIADRLGVSVSSVHNYLRARNCPDCGGPVASPLAVRCIACTAHVPTIQSRWTAETVRDAIRVWTHEHGRPPTYHEWTPSRSRPGRWEAESRWPSAAVVSNLYRDHRDPWNAALADAGAAIRFRRWSDDAIRAALAAYWTRTGRTPTAADLRTPDWQGPTSSTLRRRFGSVADAWLTLGPVPA